ncbi:MAG: universal stress protein [Desulfobulbaceae bacterium]|nr:universal stress protein [Desulfobulbaceae bacterium]
MRIVIALDTHSYSEAIVSEAAKLAANTWADITMLGVQPSSSGDMPDTDLEKRLRQYRKSFLSRFNEGDNPYGGVKGAGKFTSQNGGFLLTGDDKENEFRKKLHVKIRVGDATKEILAEAREQECDLIIIGCTKGLDCQWQGEIDLPRKIAQKADYSVLVIKERKTTDTISCCLDQDQVSQSSLEMINQMVTLHQAELKIVGLTDSLKAGGKEGVENKMAEILKYYADLELNPWIKLVRLEDLEEYVAQASRQGMIALWMGKKSLLGKIFSRDLVGKLVNTSQSSVMILR